MIMKPPHHSLAASLCQAMASPLRMRALTLLAQGPWTVGTLSEELNESIATTSAHLKILRSAHLVEAEKRGREVWCRITSPHVVSALAAVQRAAEALIPEFRELLREQEDDPFVAADLEIHHLADRSARQQQDLALVDLRPESEFIAGHLPGAISRPFESLPDRDLGDLLGRERVLAYCRGPWCAKARRGVRLLNERGVPARRLRGGVIEWQAAGLSLEH